MSDEDIAAAVSGCEIDHSVRALPMSGGRSAALQHLSRFVEQALPGYDFPSYFNPADYITDGRDAFTGAFQPRIGFSYDVFDDERTVIFGGAGRYYDRVQFNFAFDERFKPLQFNKEIFFSQAGGPRGGVNTVAWHPIYLTPAGLEPAHTRILLIRGEKKQSADV